MTFPKELRTLQFVPRWAIVRTSRTQSVAEHSYYVALYSRWIIRAVCCIKWLADNDVGVDEVLDAALTHDIEESFTSDIPNPIKKYAGLRENVLFKAWESKTATDRFGDFYKEPREPIKRIVMLADIMEACAFLSEELRMGNKEVQEILNTMMEILEDFCKSDKYLEMTCRNHSAYKAIFDHLYNVEHKCDTVTKSK